MHVMFKASLINMENHEHFSYYKVSAHILHCLITHEVIRIVNIGVQRELAA
jgi:hypothetical protein